ncbi:hypothetical protein YPPY95_2903, partial [Yersinia pestis PY-95]
MGHPCSTRRNGGP